MSDEVMMAEEHQATMPAKGAAISGESSDIFHESQESLNRRHIKWRCRRGMLELDLMLEPFVDYAFDVLSPTMKEKFVVLLSETDQQLQRWLLGNDIPKDPKIHDLVLVIRYYASKRY